MTSTTGTSRVSDLAASVAADSPRLVVLCAPAGHGKGAFLREYARRFVGPLVLCDVDREGDLRRAVLDALTAGDPRRAGFSAADRLAQPAGAAGGHAREALRREWPIAETPDAFAIRDAVAALTTPVGADLFEELVSTLPPQRVLLVSMRNDVPPALDQVVRRVASRTIDAADLRLDAPGALALARAHRVSEPVALSIFEMTGGWPLTTRLFLHLASRGSVDADLAEAARTLTPDALLALALHRTIARSDEDVRRALVVTMLLGTATHAQLVRILGDGCDDLVFGRLTGLPFVTAGSAAAVHPEAAAIVRARFSTLLAEVFERVLTALTGEGAYVDAAHVALAAGDVARAAAIIDAAPPYTSAPVPLGEYERVIDRLDRDVLTSYPNVWIATIPHRSFAVDRATFVREAETVYFCLPPGTSSDQRAAALMLLASAYVNSGRSAEADQLLDDALDGFAREPIPARAALLHFRAWLYGMEGRFAAARALAAEAAQIKRGGFGETQTLHYIDAHEAAFRGQKKRVVVIVDELLRRSDALPLHRANTAANGALFAWACGDDDQFMRYVSILEDALTPGLERGFRPILDGARGRPIALPDGFDWAIGQAQAQLFRLGSARTHADALDAAEKAARYADERGDAYTQLHAHAAVYVLAPDRRAREAAYLSALVARVESEEMRAAVSLLLRDEPPGILEPFISRRVLRNDAAPSGHRLHVQLLAGVVVRDGTPVRLSDKEFELVALLGSAHAPLSRDRIGEALWDHLDPEEWGNNIKVTMSRLRRKLGLQDAIVLVNGRYRLAPEVEVDLRHVEAVMRDFDGGPLDERTRLEFARIAGTVSSAALGRYDRAPSMRPVKARIEDVVCRAGSALARDALDRGRLDAALRIAADVTALDPHNETACEITLRALSARGDVDAARHTLRRYAAALMDDLGAEPPPRLVDLVQLAR